MDYNYESLGYEKQEEEVIERWPLEAEIKIMTNRGKWITNFEKEQCLTLIILLD